MPSSRMTLGWVLVELRGRDYTRGMDLPYNIENSSEDVKCILYRCEMVGNGTRS
jgi:hypothetical protein